VRALVTLVVACQHARSLHAAPVDHVHAHYATYPALAAWTLHRLLGLPYSFTAHAHDLYIDQSMLARKVADACFVVTISHFNLAISPPARRRARTSPSMSCTAASIRRCTSSAHRPCPPRGVRALCVASLQEYKGA